MWVRLSRDANLMPHLANITTYLDNINLGPLSSFQKVASAILSRANRFLTMLSTDVALKSAGVDVDQYLTLCMFSTSLELSSSTEEFNMFCRSSRTCVTRQTRCMVLLSQIWTKEEGDGALYR